MEIFILVSQSAQLSHYAALLELPYLAVNHYSTGLLAPKNGNFYINSM